MRMYLKIVVIKLVLLTLINSNSAFALPDSENYSFKVFLDEKEIGYHTFNIERSSGKETVKIDADFDVKLLFINVYSYAHQAKEIWQDQCLQQIDSTTRESGDDFFVKSTNSEQGINIENKEGTSSIEGCVKSFAYWDVQRLNDVEKLLNSQTGKHVPATLTEKGPTQLKFDGKEYDANLFVLDAEDAAIELFYDADGRWLALKTQVKGGRTLAYMSKQMIGS